LVCLGTSISRGGEMGDMRQLVRHQARIAAEMQESGLSFGYLTAGPRQKAKKATI
jgi:hypothetical protein